jgi:3-dehydroquinate synthase
MDAEPIDVAGERPYQVLVGRDLLDRLPGMLPGAAQVAVVFAGPVRELADRVGEKLRGQGIGVLPIEVPDAEAAKTVEVAGRCWDALGGAAFTRTDAVVGVGGGAVTDLAGYVAASWLRGVRWVPVATSLLGMVDAAVGGKTGINIAAGKNLVGAFHPPAGVVCDLGSLDSLPREDLVAGLAEVVKCGFIADAKLLDLLEQSGPDLTVAQHQEVITRAVRVKADVVASDETEAGRRAILNFGHTVGHALEAASGYGLLHGEAVALGMVAALDLGAVLGVGAPALADRARALLARLGLPVDYERRFDAQAQAGLTVDKKRRGSTIRFVLVPTVGETRFLELTPADIASHLARRPGAKA